MSESATGVAETELPPMKAITLRKVVFASFPRSGHHMTVNLLSKYWGENLRYCEPYEGAISPAHNLVKTHDFKLDERYFSPRMVLIRNPLDSLASYYDWSLKRGLIKVDSYDEWIKFATKNVRYWRNFYVKWLHENRQKMLLLNYSDLLKDPRGVLTQAIQFQCEGHEVEEERLVKAINHVNPRVRGTYRTFRYADPSDETALTAVAWL